MIIEQLIAANKVAKKETNSQSSESNKRSLVKSVSWRIIGTIDTILISWYITGTLTLAFSIGLIELFTKMVLFFFHERAWNRIKWGRKSQTK